MTCVIMYKNVILADSLCMSSQANAMTHQPKLFQSDDMVLSVVGPTTSLEDAKEYFKLCRYLFEYDPHLSKAFVVQALAKLKSQLPGNDAEVTLFAATQKRRLALTIDSVNIKLHEDGKSTKFDIDVSTPPIVTDDKNVFFIAGAGDTAGHVYRDTHKDASPVQIMQHVYKVQPLVGGPLHMVDLDKLKPFDESVTDYKLKPAKIVA